MTDGKSVNTFPSPGETGPTHGLTWTADDGTHRLRLEELLDEILPESAGTAVDGAGETVVIPVVPVSSETPNTTPSSTPEDTARSNKNKWKRAGAALAAL